MSYILEALKKSEQERNPDRVPDLTTHHEQVAQVPQKSFPWLWLVIALVVLNLVVIYWFFFHQPAQQSMSTEVTEQVVTSQPIVSETVADDMAPAQAIPQPEEQVVTQPVVEEPVIQQAPVAADPVVSNNTVSEPIQQPVQAPRVLGFNELPHVSELSLSIQNQLPDMVFTTHIYVEDGGSFVIINNRNLSGGMPVGNGLVLERIVREGVIMSFRSRYFTLNSMESWTR